MRRALLWLFGSAALVASFKPLKSWVRPNASLETPNGQAVLITGASSGIGQVIAKTLAQAGYQVYGTVRNQTDGLQLEALSPQITALQMDLQDSTSIIAALETLRERLGHQALYGLINNAGIGVIGPLALLPRAELKRQFEVNIFGLHEVTQQALSLMKPGSKIIQISSITGETTQPFTGAYSASKHALEALSDALRRELQIIQSGIEVVIIQPGSIETPIWDKINTDVDLENYQGTPYQRLSEALYQRMQNAYGKREKPEKVAQVVLDILQRPRNAPRYWVSNDPMEEIIVPRLLPARALDWVFRKILT